jgi:hypothetical protein
VEKPERIKMLYIGGSHRSGSTLLEHLLCNVAGVASYGEVKSIWIAGFIENLLCGCGETFRDCGQWQQIVQESFGGMLTQGSEKLDRALYLSRELARTSYVLKPNTLPPALLEEFSQEYVAPLYKSIARRTGCNVLVEPSNVAWYFRVLKELPEVDLYLLHLVRAPQAVVHSYRRKKLRHEFGDKEVYTPVHSLPTSLKHWWLNNRAILRESKTIPHYMRLHYEDFVQEPQRTVREVLRFVGLDAEGELPFFLPDGSVRLAKNEHTILGNPIRFGDETREIKLDNQWQKKMPMHERAAISMLMSPLVNKLKKQHSNT